MDIHIRRKEEEKKRKRISLLTIILIKVVLISILLIGLYYTKDSYSNTISLLAVNEDQQGNIYGGSIIYLDLTVKPGSGKTYVNLNTIEEIDTQASIINSQKIACQLFEEDCQNYDFYYTFRGQALLLKGPSASSAIAILTAKTLNHEPMDNTTVITGSLSSGGLIGNVGGVDQKIAVAQDMGFKKVLVPSFAKYNETVERKIEVERVSDIIDAYNEFGEGKYEPKIYDIDKESYESLMTNLSDKLCSRAELYSTQINKSKISANSPESQALLQAENNINSSKNSIAIGNYYSAGSFCYSANINYKFIIEMQNNTTNSDLSEQYKQLTKDMLTNINRIESEEYRNNLQTINDVYVTLLARDRLEEVRDNLKKINVDSSSSPANADNLYTYSTAVERYYTVGLWEEFEVHNGNKVNISGEQIFGACEAIGRDLNVKSQILASYNVDYFNNEIQEVQGYQRDNDWYLCIYRGLELNARINLVLNSVDITNNESTKYAEELHNITLTRVSVNSDGEFPLIPYIYHEYSGELLKKGDVSSSLLYSNYALSYGDLNTYLAKEDRNTAFKNEMVDTLYSNMIFILALLILIAFIGI